MEKLPKKSMLTGVVGDLGVTPGIKERRVERQHAERFQNQEFPDLKDKERPKTEIESRILERIDRVTSARSAFFGGGGISIPAQNVHVIKAERWPEVRGSQGEEAVLKIDRQAIAIGDCPLVPFARKITHEMIHGKMSNRIFIPPVATPPPILHRSKREGAYRVNITTTPFGKAQQRPQPIYLNGLEMLSRDGKRKVLTHLNEGLLEELSQQQFSEIAKDPDIAAALKRSEAIIQKNSHIKLRGVPLPSVPSVYYVEITPMKGGKPLIDETGRKIQGDLAVSETAYRPGRRALLRLADKILQKNPQLFKTREDVVNVFAHSAYTGRPSRARGLVDATFGKGTFEKISEIDQNIDELEKFVSRL